MTVLVIIFILVNFILLLVGLKQLIQNNAFTDIQIVFETVFDRMLQDLKNGTVYDRSFTCTVNGVEFSKYSNI